MIVKEQGAGGTSINILTVSLHLVRAFQFINHFHILMKFSKKMWGWVEKGCFFFFFQRGKAKVQWSEDWRSHYSWKEDPEQDLGFLMPKTCSCHYIATVISCLVNNSVYNTGFKIFEWKTKKISTHGIKLKTPSLVFVFFLILSSPGLSWERNTEGMMDIIGIQWWDWVIKLKISDKSALEEILQVW